MSNIIEFALTAEDIGIIARFLAALGDECAEATIVHHDDGRFPGPLIFGWDESGTFGFLGFKEADDE